MTYVVKFGVGDAERFALLYSAFVTGGNNLQERKDIEKLRREIAVLDKFAAISSRPPGVPEAAEGTRVMNEGAHEVVLDHPQFQMVKRHLESMVAVTATTGARRMVELVDWFDGI
jgi:hypothetical protein